jgi:pyridoxal phosphate enzyme (YggS family)
VLSAGVEIASNLARVRDQIGQAALRAGRRPEEVTLVGVSKTHPPDEVAAAVRAGLRDVGENRVQEAAPKIPAVRSLVDTPPVWHLVGHLQTNKVNVSVELFDAIDSVDSLHLAKAISKRLHDHRHRRLPILLEVYVGTDPERPGLRPDGLIETVGQIVDLPGLEVHGLMTVAPLGEDPRPAFRQVAQLRNRLTDAYRAVHFDVLSMGMSEDFLVAIEEGSTQVRIGTAIFGPRRSR